MLSPFLFLKFVFLSNYMKPKNVIIGLLLALVILILFQNKEESSFWLFGEIRTSKLLILGIFFLLGVVTGGILFRRKNKHPEEYIVRNELTDSNSNSYRDHEIVDSSSSISNEDKEYLRND